MQGNSVSLLKSLFVLSQDQIQRKKKKKKADRVRHSGLSERRANSPFSTDCKEISQRLTKILAKLPRVLPTVRSGHVTSLKHSKLLASLLVLLCVVL